jgi:hypothetical protein
MIRLPKLCELCISLILFLSSALLMLKASDSSWHVLFTVNPMEAPFWNQNINFSSRSNILRIFPFYMNIEWIYDGYVSFNESFFDIYSTVETTARVHDLLVQIVRTVCVSLLFFFSRKVCRHGQFMVSNDTFVDKTLLICWETNREVPSRIIPSFSSGLKTLLLKWLLIP